MQGSSLKASHATKLAAIDSNFDQFLADLPGLMAEHEGEWALLRDRVIVAYFATAMDAQIAGNQGFPDKRFSIQEVTDRVEELWIYTYAFDQRQA